MPRIKLLSLAAVLSYGSVSAAQSPFDSSPLRFAGAAQLMAPAGTSSDGRFQVDAMLMPPGTPDFSDAKPSTPTNRAPLAPKANPQTGGRFGVNADLFSADHDTAQGVSCASGGPILFTNGFEN